MRNVIGNMVGLSGSAQALKTNRDTLQHSSIREGERAHKLAVLYSANITQPMCSPLARKYLHRHSHGGQVLLGNRCSNAILLDKLLASY